MTDVTIKTLAAERQTSVERLVQQFADAGIRKSADDSVSAQEKQTLIDHLNQKNSGPDKLTLQRKTRSTLNIPGTGGKSKSVQIEVRKKRTFVKRDPHGRPALRPSAPPLYPGAALGCAAARPGIGAQ